MLCGDKDDELGAVFNDEKVENCEDAAMMKMDDLLEESQRSYMHINMYRIWGIGDIQ